jgi:hypothetical protein
MIGFNVISWFFFYSFKDEFGEDCGIFLKYIDENDWIYVEYNGKDVSFFCDDISFKGRGNDILDEYEVCVTPLSFYDPDCAVRLDYKDSTSSRILQVTVMFLALLYHFPIIHF